MRSKQQQSFKITGKKDQPRLTVMSRISSMHVVGIPLQWTLWILDGISSLLPLAMTPITAPGNAEMKDLANLVTLPLYNMFRSLE